MKCQFCLEFVKIIMTTLNFQDFICVFSYDYSYEEFSNYYLLKSFVENFHFS